MNNVIYLENDTDIEFDFDFKEIADKVVCEATEVIKCPFECEVNILLTVDEEIHVINRETRGIDRATDVLSFPNLFFDEPARFEVDEASMADIVNPETGRVILGEMIISLDRVKSQAESYGHSTLREYAFLIAHSMLHLMGFDHMSEEEAAVMEQWQKIILDRLGITRE